MIRKVSIALVAAVAPLVLAVAIGEITIQVKQRITDWLYGGLSPIVLWHLAWGFWPRSSSTWLPQSCPSTAGFPSSGALESAVCWVLAQSLVYLGAGKCSGTSFHSTST